MHDEARAAAEDIERANPRWIVVFGAHSQEFFCLPRFPVPPRTSVIARYPAAVVPRMRQIEKLYLSAQETEDGMTDGPSGALAGPGICEITTRELARLRAFLEWVISRTAPASGMRGELGAALAEVSAEQDMRATAYERHACVPYRCACGFGCEGLAVIDGHLGGFWDDEMHYEISPAQV